MMISKLYLLLQNIIHFDQLDSVWQLTIQNLAGWSQSTKELLANKEAETINDRWLVIGQHEETNEEVVTQRNWLVGEQSGKTALILNFSTNYSNFETHLLAGSVLEAELAFFPSVVPHRAVFKAQKELSNEPRDIPILVDNWHAVHQSKLEQLKINPWSNDMVFAVKNTRMVQQNGAWIITDQDHQGLPLTSDVNVEKCLKWLVISGNRPIDLVCVMRDDKILPLGLFHNQTYTVL